MVRADRGRHPQALPRIVAIALGGALGTLARDGADHVLSVGTTGFPWSTFLVNVTGSFVLAAILTLLVERLPPTQFVRPFAAIGFCGGFTTFSTFAVEIVQRGQHGRAGLAALYLAASLVVGLAAAVAGITVVRGRLVTVGARRMESIPDPDDLGVLYDRAAGMAIGVGGATVDTDTDADEDEDEDPVPA